MKQRTGNTNPRGRGRTLLIALVLLILYAYAVQVTRIDLDEPLEATRQRNLVSMLRELARPDLFTYATETVSTDLSIRMPCPEDVKASQISSRGRTFLLAPNCASTTQDVLVFQGSGLPPNESGVLRWYPAGAQTTRTLVQFESDADGEARVTFTMPDIRETAEPQRIEIVEVTSRQLTGLSETA
ncbi:MAG: hypothetical protein KC425_03540, partial [Anaerolineales bacterium]|nr:hypothetical protein [Anaerolineales bacterium]